MRTLKKTLSLVLVVAMVLGLCVVGASAYNKVEDFTDDVDKIGDAYYEAVGVLTGIQVIDGMTETSFQPQGNYTREQAAKIIAYMMLGKADADSLRCTKAPFDDVAADRWSAGYIAFCVEQGIIDGMTETTFEPTGTLTGFQWAKMLLCAVGFGVKGEFTGSSWSLNTAKYAHNVDLFAGDLAGADHTAITREQAALYAFNVLTAVDLVVYSESLGDYIKGYNSWFVDRYTPQGTLAETVFKLYNTTGVVVNNEAMGNGTTDISKDYSDANVIAKVKASTGLDMMYHGVKVWFTGTAATKTAAASGTAVFVTDLAKVTEYCCYDIAAGRIAAGKLSLKAMETIGTGTDYEFDIVDNSAVGQGTATVTTRAYLATLGYASTVNKTTNLNILGGATVPVKNDYFKTDISAITSKTTPNVVIEASEKAYHVYAPTATSGAVTKVTKEANGSYTMTLSDGTVLKESKLTYGDKQAAINDVIDILAGRDHITPTYYFLLDTHGHYMYLSNEYFKTVAYFTGVLKPVSEWNSWSNAVAFVAQFVDVEDPTQVEEIPVTKAWAAEALALINTSTGRSDMMWYYDITDELYGDATYAPEAVFTPGTSYTYGTKYAYSNNIWIDSYDERDFTIKFSFDQYWDEESKTWIEVDKGYMRYDPDTIVFNIAFGAGDDLEIETYVGVDALVKGYAEKFGTYVFGVNLNHAVATYQKTSVGNDEVLTVFGFEDTDASGHYLFVPNTITWGSVTDNYYTLENVAYINGSAELGTLKFEKDYFERPTSQGGLGKTLQRGFYDYNIQTVNGVNYTYLNRVTAQDMGYETIGKIGSIETAGSKAWINGNPVASDCTFVDVRTGAGTAFDSVTDFISFCNANMGQQLLIAYMWIGTEKQISVIYVVDDIYGVADVKMDDALVGWTVTPMVYEGGTIKLYNNTALANIAGNTKINLTYQWREYWFDQNGNKVYVSDGAWTNGYKSAVGTVYAGTTPYISVAINDLVPVGTQHKQVEVEILGVSYDVKVVNNATTFEKAYVKTPGNSADPASVVEFTTETTYKDIPVGNTIAVCVYDKDVASGTVATVDLAVEDDMKVTFNSSGYAWTDPFVAETNVVTINSVTAKYQLKLDENVPVVWFGTSVDSVNATEVFTSIPGVQHAVVLKYSGSKAQLESTDGQNLAWISTGTATSYKSNETAGTVAQYTGDFLFSFRNVNFDAVTVAAGSDVNVVTVSFDGWKIDTP